MVEVSKEEGRQGETRNEMRWVLLISTLLAVLVLGAFLFFNTGADTDTAQQPTGSATTAISSSYLT